MKSNPPNLETQWGQWGRMGASRGGCRGGDVSDVEMGDQLLMVCQKFMLSCLCLWKKKLLSWKNGKKTQIAIISSSFYWMSAWEDKMWQKKIKERKKKTILLNEREIEICLLTTKLFLYVDVSSFFVFFFWVVGYHPNHGIWGEQWRLQLPTLHLSVFAQKVLIIIHY